jgi:DNA-binding transcriptional LysR family regulator
VLRTPSFQTALSIVARTSLIATVPKAFAESFASQTQVAVSALPFDAPALRFGLIFAATRKDDPSHRWFRERGNPRALGVGHRSDAERTELRAGARRGSVAPIVRRP